MSTGTPPVDGPGVDGPEVVSAVDESGDGAQFVLADIARDDAWASVAQRDAPSLDDWR